MLSFELFLEGTSKHHELPTSPAMPSSPHDRSNVIAPLRYDFGQSSPLFNLSRSLNEQIDAFSNEASQDDDKKGGKHPISAGVTRRIDVDHGRDDDCPPGYERTRLNRWIDYNSDDPTNPVEIHHWYWGCVEYPGESSGGGTVEPHGWSEGRAPSTKQDKDSDKCLDNWTLLHDIIKKRLTRWAPCKPSTGLGDCCLTDDEKKRLICIFVQLLLNPVISGNPELKNCLMQQWMTLTIGCDKSFDNPRIKGVTDWEFPFDSKYARNLFDPWLQKIHSSGHTLADGSFGGATVLFSKQQINSGHKLDVLLPLISLCIKNRFPSRADPYGNIIEDAAIILGYGLSNFFDCDWLKRNYEREFKNYQDQNPDIPEAQKMHLVQYIESCCNIVPLPGKEGSYKCPIKVTNLFIIDPCSMKTYFRQDGLELKENINDKYIVKGNEYAGKGFWGKNCPFFTNPIITPLDDPDNVGLRFISDTSVFG